MERERRKRPKKDSKAAAFEKFKQVKSGGSKYKYEVGEVVNVYDEVSEKEYTKRVLQRQDDDWIVSDGVGSDYVEDGREIFDDDLDEETIHKEQKSRKRSRSGFHKTTEGSKRNIQQLIANMPTRKEKSLKLDEDHILGSLIKELDDTLDGSSLSTKRSCTGMPNSEKKETEDYLKSFSAGPVLKRPIKTYSRVVLKEQNDGDDSFDHLKNSRQNSKVTDSMSANMSLSKTNIPVDTNATDLFLDDLDLDVNFHRDWDNMVINAAQCKTSTASDLASAPEAVPSIPVESRKIDLEEISGENVATEFENETTTSSMTWDASQIPFKDGENGKKTFKFFYWDMYEDVFNQPGTVYIFGKVVVESSNLSVSCCVRVKNIPRRVYLLPRKKNRVTDEDVKIIHVYQEFNSKIAEKYRIMKYKSRQVNRNYAFNLPGIPDNCDYFEVVYPASDSVLPSDLQGDTFSHIFGTNRSYLEMLLIDRKIKGPSWLNIQDATPSTNRFSWCKFDIDCSDMEHIIVNKEQIPPPPLVVMALKIRVAPIPKSHENQISMIGCLVHNQFHTDKPAPSSYFQQQFCALTKPTNVTWPYDTKESLSRGVPWLKDKSTSSRPDNPKQLPQFIKTDQKFSERELLQFFLAKYYKIDPDLIVGHDIFGFDIGTLIHRLVVNKVMDPSRLGRLRRKNLSSVGKGRTFAERSIMCGRLMCDIKLSAKELISARSYDLDALCEQVLHIEEGQRREIKAEEIPAMYSSSESIMELMKLTMKDAESILKILYDLNIIPLSLQITNIAGNVLSRTLMGGRSERNEYLLLHAFSEKDYIVPDKIFSKKATKDSTLNEGPGMTKGKRKSQYEGGLVLDPKKGFYDKFILLMDFNSLYPSIIQEYNICFTTFAVREMNFNSENDLMLLMDNVPSNNSPGILPTEIKKLVDSRKEVKNLMAAPHLPEDRKHQYNIRQMALKLTANSMYGCLGFPNSRFYAKPLAAMVTAKGREILINTRDLVQKLNFDVIYGDTDSLMINTNCVNYDEVFSVGKKIKAEVNKLYRKIELDIDGVFKFMLLLKKKKYAAVTISKSYDGNIVTKQELKGLDIVRRDWSKISAATGRYVVNEILSDQNIEDKIANIHARLRKIKTDLEEERVPLPLLAITKQLTKNPQEYPDKKALPHVQIAIRMNSNMAKKFKQGDTIAYVICEDGTTNAATQRGYHVDEKKARTDLKIDVKYYLSQQIHPVVSRLCEPIDGIDAIQIAESLGLDTTAYQHIRRLDNDLNEEDDIIIDDSDKYKNCDDFEFKCINPNCGIINIMDGPIVKNDRDEFILVLDRCTNANCSEKPYNNVYQLQNKLWLTIRKYINKYYSRWMVCEDATCSFRTRDIKNYNKKLEIECSQCRGNVLVREYTESQLFNQLCYFQYMFDISNAISKNKSLSKDKNDPSFQAYANLKELVDLVLKSNSYNIIDLGKICEILMMK